MRTDTRNIAAGKFKTHCLEIMDIVNHDKIEYVITKHGVPVAKMVPIKNVENPSASLFGYMQGTITFVDDIIEPADISWSAESGDHEH